jgi:putative transposase
MIYDRPPRLSATAYVGIRRYHVRVSTWNREPHLAVAETAAWVLEQLMRRLSVFGFSILAYCFMPDHVHLLLESNQTDASLVALIGHWKQETGFRFKQMHGVRLWQSSFFDRVLREHESSATVAAYILGNPIRAGLASTVGEHPFSWCVWGNDVDTESQG